MLILRVDDRLIHGQVVAGWARPLGIESLVLASDTVSGDEWACSAYRLAVPEGMNFLCCDIRSCIAFVANGREKSRVMIVVEKMADAFSLVAGGVQVKEINIGGISYTGGARTIAPYIYLSPDDIDWAVKLYQMGVHLIGKQLPNSPPIDIAKKLAGVK